MTDATMTMLDAALQYATRGWPVFPCRPKGKVPLTPRGFKDATTDADTIRAHWQRWPDANIGIPTGTASGFVVIDIDGERGAKSFAELAAGHNDTETLISKTGGGGLHLLFQCPEPPITNTQSKLGPGIDTRGEGGYIIVPPSVHESGNAYAWPDPDLLMADLPDWLRPEERPKQESTPMSSKMPAVHTDDKLARASAYLATMDPAIQGCGGHSALYAAAVVLVHGFDLDDEQAFALLANEFNPRCSPPWDLGTAKDARDFRRKITEARKQPHDQPKGWLLAGSGYSTAGDAEHGARIASALMQNHKAQTATKPRETPQGLPAWILEPPGVVGQLCGWMNATAFKRQPVLSLANSLAFWGAVVGRKVRDELDLRTNLYCLGVGASGCGKDHSRKAIKALCQAAGVADKLLGGEDLASDSALLTAVGRNETLLFQFDEIGHMIAAHNSKNAANYQRAIPVTLTKLYSSASTVYLGKEYADDTIERKDIDQPNACVYGTTVPSTFFDGISPTQIRDGFLGRMLVFFSDDEDPDPTGNKPGAPPEHLIAQVQAWYARKIDPPPGSGNLAEHLKAYQLTVNCQPEAEAVFLDLRSKARARRRGRDLQEAGLDSLWSRAEENARKVSLVVASGCAFDGITIGEDVARYACTLVEYLTGRMVEMVGQNMADTDYGRNKVALLNAIRERGLTKREISRGPLRSVPKRDRDQIIGDLLETGDAVWVETNTGGRPRCELCHAE